MDTPSSATTLQQALGVSYLTEAELREVALRSVKDVELQWLQARMNWAMHPDEEALQQAALDLAEQLRRLVKFLAPALPALPEMGAAA
ncbi:MAG: hypothetical protein FJX77_02190 [Armatimonadetes bacterium]|nr:hypothetical protein [Armatimonadota bacterium]